MYNVSFPYIGLNFTVNPVLCSFGNITIRWYGLFIAVGFLLAILYAMKSSKRFNVDENKLLNTVIVGLLCGIVGARLYYVVFFPGDQYIKNPISIFYINEGGLGIYGGIIFGLLAGIIMSKIQKVKILPILDLASLGFLIGQGIGRWGNFTNQEAFGTQTDLPWGMLSENTAGMTVHPCFLYESIWCILGFVLLHIFSRKLQHHSGETFSLYLIWYGSERFFVEALRTDSLYIPNTGLKVSQVVAVCAIIFGITMLIVLKSRKENNYVKNN